MSALKTKVAASEDLGAAGVQAKGVQTSDDNHYQNWPNDIGFYAQGEQKEPRKLKVSGTFPSWCHGDLLRIGPGSHKFPRINPNDGELSVDHWFDGFSHVHKFTITSGTSEKSSKIMYQSRRQADEKLIEAQRTGKLDGISFGQKRDPCDTFFKKIKTIYEPINSKAQGMEDISVAFVKTAHLKSTPFGGEEKRSKTISATSDRVVTREFDISTLEPYGVTNQSVLHPSLNGQLSAAHNQVDPETGDVFNYNLACGPRPTYRVFRTNASNGTTDILATISGKGVEAAYLHSFFLTQNFIILCIWPAFLAAGGSKVLWERNIVDAIAPFDPKKKATWCVVDRRHNNGMVAKFESDAMFCFHTVNAWEEEPPPAYDETEASKKQRNCKGGCCSSKRNSSCGSGKSSSCGSSKGKRKATERQVNIVAELVEYPNTDLLHRFYLDNLKSSGPGACKYAVRPGKEDLSLTRYRLASVPLHTASRRSSGCCGNSTDYNTNKCMRAHPAEVLQRIRAPAAGDLPNINPGFAMRPHRFVYGVLDRGFSSFVDAIGKTDTHTGRCKVWSIPHHSPGEPMFVADPNGVEEDDGVLLTVILDGDRGTSYLLALDAREMVEVARAEVGEAVPFGFHGMHLPER